MATYGAAPEEGGFDEVFNASPDREVHTSAAAETAFLLGLVALAAAPFSVMHGVALAAGIGGFLAALVGVASASRPDVAGGVLAPTGLFCAVVALVLVGMRYLGVDTAFGDELLPTLRGWLESLNSQLPVP